MINLDTNVLLRCFIDDDKTQAAQARRLLELLEKNEHLYISSYAMMELVWAFRTYKISRRQMVEYLRFLLNLPRVIIGNRQLVASAIEIFADGSADFADYLILCEGRLAKAEFMASFDSDLVKEQLDVNHPKSLAKL